MMARCNRPTAGGYEFYGGRGIRVCERWNSFEAFLADMGERPHGKTLERINNAGHYEPGNCRWASRAEQDANKRSSLFVEFRGRIQSLQAWCAELGLNWSTVYSRLNGGMTPEEAFTTPLRCAHWMPQEDAILRAFYPGEGRTIASRLPGRTAVAVQRRANVLKIRNVVRHRARA